MWTTSFLPYFSSIEENIIQSNSQDQNTDKGMERQTAMYPALNLTSLHAWLSVLMHEEAIMYFVRKRQCYSTKMLQLQDHRIPNRGPAYIRD